MAKTFLFGGLTPLHERFIKGALESLGYKALPLPEPDLDSYRFGTEYCSRGMCNPTYWTVGNLVKFLKEAEKRGVEVEKKFSFITVGACGPCRFGMYEEEYRRALKEAGFKNFRVSILNQSSFSSEGEISITRELVWRLIKAVSLADILRDLGYKLRPYETERGSVDSAVERASQKIYELISEGASLASLTLALLSLKRELSSLSFDYSGVKPLVSVIGEFWAHTTESYGNYKLHSWLEEEGAEVKVEPVMGWIDYQLFMEKEKIKRDFKVKGFSKKRLKRLFGVLALRRAVLSVYNLFRAALSFRPSPLPKQELLASLAKPYFDKFVVGGEGHLEVAKHVYNARYKKAHLTISVKPFGCMPSTQSDAAQVKVLEDYPDSLFISIETSGEGEVNVKSRVQMKLYEAKQMAREELFSLAAPARAKEIFSEPSLKKAFIPLDDAYISTSARALSAHIKGGLFGLPILRKALSGA